MPETSALLPTETNVEIPMLSSVGVVEDGDPERTGSGSTSPRCPRGGRDGAELPVEADRRVGVEHAHAVGADHPHSRRSNDARGAPSSSARPASPVSLNPAEITTSPLTPFSAHSRTAGDHVAGRDHDEGQIDRSRRCRDTDLYALHRAHDGAAGD